VLRNYFKIAWRSLVKNKFFSFINILGLGLAIPFSLLSLMQAQSTYEFDNFHSNPGRTYRIITDVAAANGVKSKYASSSPLLADKLNTDYPFVEKTTRTVRDFNWELTNKIKTIKVNSLYVEPAFFDIFNFSLEKGTAPAAPNTIALTHEMGEIFFGTSNPVGKTLLHHDLGLLTVSGILKPFKKTTHFRTDVMVSMATLDAFNKNRKADASWADYNGSTFTYVLLQQNADSKTLDAALQRVAGIANENKTTTGQTFRFRKQRLRDISPDFEELKNNPYVESFRDLALNFGLALVIVLLAGFNYANLMLARSLGRAKEVGVRKVAGAKRSQLISQFVCEAILVSLLALAVGYFILHFMRQFIHVGWITWEVENPLILWGAFIVFAIFIGVLSGIMPAWILSGFRAAKVLKGNIRPVSFGKIGMRKALVVVQFVITSCFIFLIAHMYSQFQYMATDNENFNRRNIFNISLTGSEYKLLMNDIAANKNVERIGLASTPFGGGTAQCGIRPSKNGDNSAAYYYAANAGFVENMNLSFAAGQNLPSAISGNSDSSGNFVLLNEHAVAVLGLGTPREAIGKLIYLNNSREVIVNGVLKDFCFGNYQSAVQPLVIQYNPSQFHILSIKTKTEVGDAGFLDDMKRIWKSYNPYEDLAYSWYEKELYERYYPGADMRFLGMVSIIIFVIAIMGLLGMVTYNVEKRIKEVGIRKVLGASVFGIVRELSSGYVKLIMIAACIAIPIGYVSGVMFLKIFTFNNGVDIWLMCSLFALIFLIALFTIGIKAALAAVVNPVKSLRAE
jgi:putative ABC transport system permease protein